MNQNFEKLYLQTRNSVYRFVSLRVSSLHDAEDLVGDIYYKALRSAETGTKMTKAWIFSIASNTLKNYYRDHKPFTDIPEGLLSTNDLEGAIISSARAAELMASINKLSIDEQLLVSLRYFAELPYKDISKIMGISVSASKTRMSRCLIKLKKMISERSY